MGFFGRLGLSKMKKPEIAGNVMKGVGQISDMTRNLFAKSGEYRMREAPYTMGQRELSQYGYERYNIPGESDIYFSKAPETVMFNEGEPIVVKAEPGEFVGLDTEQETQTEIAAEPEPVAVPDVPERSPEDLFAGIPRGGEWEVETQVGTLENGEFKELVVEEAVVAEECMRIAAAPVQIPVAAEPEWTVSDDTSDAFVGYIAMIPAESTFEVAKAEPVWEISDASAESFVDYIAMIPAESTFAIIPVWDVTEEASESFMGFIGMIPEEEPAPVVAEVPEWDVTEMSAESFVGFIAMIPRESTFAIIPVWDVTEEAAMAFTEHMATVPEFEKIEAPVAWDVTEETSESFMGFIAMIPKESTFAIVPVWDVTEEASAAFVGFMASQEEMYSQAVTETKAVLLLPARIGVEPLERKAEPDATVEAPAQYPVESMTSGADTDNHRYSLDTDISKETLAENVKLDRPIRASRFVYKDGRIQKVRDEQPLDIDSLDKVVSNVMTESATISCISHEVSETYNVVPETPQVPQRYTAPVRSDRVSFSFGRCQSPNGGFRF